MIRRAVVLSAAALLLAGCAVAPEPVVETPTPTPTQDALPSPPVGVVGTGTLDGLPFEVTWDGSDFLLTGLAGVSNGTLVISADPGVVGECPAANLVYGLPVPVPIPLASGKNTRDVTFLSSVSLVGEYTNDCYGYPVLSTAPILWSMQPLYPDLVVTDSGDTGGARGIVTLDGDIPVSYKVNQGDVLEEIAARFGITSDQLLWLNPRRTSPETVFKDETLNLSPSRR